MHGRSRLSRLLLEIRQRANLSQQAIGALAGATRSQVSRWEHDQHQPGYRKIRRLAAQLHEHHPELDDLSGQLVSAAGYDAPGTTGPPSPLTPEEQRLAATFIEVWRQAGPARASSAR